MANSGTSDFVTTHVHYFFWLPAGKDEFGFRNSIDAPFQRSSFYREWLERTISDHFQDQAERLRGSGPSLANMTLSGDRAPHDAELGLRKIEYSFSYQTNLVSISQLGPADPIEGTAAIYSNGLYRWSFKILHRSDVPPDTLEKAVEDFLANDFVERHIRRLFNFGWRPERDTNRNISYDGIMTYYQLDLVFNGIFDVAAHPHQTLGVGEFPSSASEVYDPKSLIESLSLVAFQQTCSPLFDKRKSYSLRNGGRPETDYIDYDIDLGVTPHDVKAYGARELLVSRITFAAMEQFLRVVCSFGLTHYRTGLSHCRAELVHQALLSRRNGGSLELRQPSLRTDLAVPDIEAYNTLVIGKLPALTFLDQLVAGLTDVSRPTRTPSSDTNGLEEWLYAQSTLKESRDQFTRQVEGIRIESAGNDARFAALRAEALLSEVSESRKLAEIQAEAPPPQVVLKSDVWEALNVRLAALAIALGLLEVYSSAGIWITGQLLSGERLVVSSSSIAARIVGIVHWPVVFAIAILAFYLYWKRTSAGRAKADQPLSGMSSTHVFDYSSLREPISATNGSAGVMREVAQAMVDIENDRYRTRCAGYSTFHETLSSGTERVKYSLESPPSHSHQVTYVLHVEVDRRINGEGEQLRDVRLVVRVPDHAVTAADQFDGAKTVIAGCVQKLLVGRWRSEEESRMFFSEHFGWVPPRATP